MPRSIRGLTSRNCFLARYTHEKDARYFYWTAEDGSKVLAANIKMGTMPS